MQQGWLEIGLWSKLHTFETIILVFGIVESVFLPALPICKTVAKWQAGERLKAFQILKARRIKTCSTSLRPSMQAST